jgi:ribosomal-protein-alanine N-acetyltransferase
VSIRDAKSGDVDALAAIHAQCFANAWSRDAIAALLDKPGTFGLLLDDAGLIIVRVAVDEAEILTICVVPAARKTGLGTKLLQAGSTEADKVGAKIMFLEVGRRNEPGRALYARHGFEQVGQRKGYYAPGDDALVLKARLPLTFRLGNASETE